MQGTKRNGKFVHEMFVKEMQAVISYSKRGFVVAIMKGDFWEPN